MLFRGYGFQVLLAAAGPYATILPTASCSPCCTAAIRTRPGSGWPTPPAFGILFGYAYLRSRDLWLPIGLHLGWNFTLPLFGVNLSGLRMNVTGYEMSWTAGALWSGGEYGPEASILTSAVVFAAVRVSVESADSPAVLAARRSARGECRMRAAPSPPSLPS